MKPEDLGVLRGPDDLEREWLHLFVAGPGIGEGILIAIPERGWIAVDGCRAKGKWVLYELLERWKRADEALEMLVFTHPHEDHAAGIPALLEKHEPAKIAITAGTGSGPNVIDLARAIVAEAGALSEQTLGRRHAKAALLALDRRSERLCNAVDGVHRAFDRLALHVRAPHSCEHLDEVLRQIGDGNLSRANEASIVLELVFGEARVVLGGDLPERRTKAGRPIPTGWSSVHERHGELAQHHVLKLPHHGSAEARFPPMLASEGGPRLWLVTPFSKQHLPRIHDLDGLPAWLEHQERVLLTTLTSDTTAPAGWDVRIDELSPRQPPSADPFLTDAVDTTPRVHPTFDAPVWGVALDDRGRVRKTWRGSSALRIRRGG